MRSSSSWTVQGRPVIGNGEFWARAQLRWSDGRPDDEEMTLYRGVIFRYAHVYQEEGFRPGTYFTADVGLARGYAMQHAIGMGRPRRVDLPDVQPHVFTVRAPARHFRFSDERAILDAMGTNLPEYAHQDEWRVRYHVGPEHIVV